MAYRLEQGEAGVELVIDGWELGVADSPFAGIAKIANADVVSVPGEASVALKTIALTIPPTVSAVAFTVETTDILTVASTTGWYNGMAVTLNTLVNGTGLATGRVYWVGDLSGATFKLYKNPSREATTVVDITLAGSGTISSYTLGQPVDSTSGQDPNETYPHTFIMDKNMRVWWIDNAGGTATNNLVYLGNDTITGQTSSNGRAIRVWKDHIIVFRGTSLDGIGISTIESDVDFDAAYSSSGAGGWAYGWDTVTTVSGDRRSVVVGQDDILYYADNQGLRIGSFSETTGDTLDLDDGASYTQNLTALDFPSDERGANLILAELGVDLLIGGKRGRIYPWDRISSSYNFPIIISDRIIYHMVSSNFLVYIFAGKRGRIYITNGSSVELFKKIPDHITGKSLPYFSVDDAIITQNKLIFNLSVVSNDDTALGDLDGVWVIELDSGVLYLANELSHASQGRVRTILPYAIDTSDTPNGLGLVVGWQDSTGSAYGVDIGSNDPYSGGETIIDCDIVPIGTDKFPETISQIEFKLVKPLVSGESIELLQRSSLTGSFTSIGSNSTVGAISDSFDANFENVEWLQIRVISTSTATTPSNVRLRELRVKLSL